MFANSAPYNDNSSETVRLGKLECEEVICAAGLDIPVYVGSADYITRSGKAIKSDAADKIKEAVDRCDGPVVAVVTGCCTNVASALSLYPEINDDLIVVWLAFNDLEGSKNTEEYNYRNDIEGGKLLFSTAKNLVLVCSGKVVEPFEMSKDDVDRIFYSSNALATYLRKRYREITWAQGLWDLCAESTLIIPDACRFEVSKRPVFNEEGEISAFLESSEIVVVNANDAARIIEDCRNRINNY